jgi:antitoxin component of MazEF toxin-antitoxin module
MPFYECSRKAQAFGFSLALTLPAILVKNNEVDKGSIVKGDYDFNGVLIDRTTVMRRRLQTYCPSSATRMTIAAVVTHKFSVRYIAV